MSRLLESNQIHHLDVLKSSMFRLEEKLKALDPKSIMKRGYSITTRLKDGFVVKHSDEVRENEPIRIRFAVGSVRGKVEEIEEVS